MNSIPFTPKQAVANEIRMGVIIDDGPPVCSACGSPQPHQKEIADRVERLPVDSGENAEKLLRSEVESFRSPGAAGIWQGKKPTVEEMVEMLEHVHFAMERISTGQAKQTCPIDDGYLCSDRSAATSG